MCGDDIHVGIGLKGSGELRLHDPIKGSLNVGRSLLLPLPPSALLSDLRSRSFDLAMATTSVGLGG